MEHISLSQGWQLKARDQQLPLADDFALTSGWIPAQVPGTIHQALLAAGKIADPFYGCNENDLQWIGETDWLYRCTFVIPAELFAQEHVDLCFDGLDTHATVWLNGQEILQSVNMFVPERLGVKALLRSGTNELQICFRSAFAEGKTLEAEHGKLHVWNGDASRVYVRKAQYHYGWDWGPTLLTAGPWRAVRLEAYHSRIADLHCPSTVREDLQQATLPVEILLDGAIGSDCTMQLALHDPVDTLIERITLTPTADSLLHTFVIDQPALWWPNGYGDQPRYRLTATLQQHDAELDTQTVQIGLRRLALVQEPVADEEGSSFYFAINNTPIFCGGVNWIPADSFTPRITAETYRTLLQMTADANMVMVRIWGGGIYEEECFYDICDELGLLVWQDFMFACGLYPAHDAFQASVAAEAEANVRRLRNHPSIVLWCGNNEDYSLAESIQRYDPAITSDLANSPFPARAIYEELLPAVCQRLDPTRPYWPGSPYLGSNSGDPTQGDRHTWDVWHGRMAPYQAYPDYGARFVSEFGMQALPHRATIDSFAPPEEQFAASRTLEHHNKAEGGVRRIAAYLADNLRPPADFDGMIYATQLIQAEAMAAAIRGWRRNFKGPGAYAMAGALIWQLNDCWPVTSWALVDYALRPKAAYYAAKRALAPLAVELATRPGGAEAWVVSQALESMTVTVQLALWTLAGERLAQIEHKIQLAPNQATELPGFNFDLDEPVVLGAYLLVDGEIADRAVLWPEPLKYLNFPDPELTVNREDDTVRLRVQRPAKGIWLDAGDGVQWHDNCIDLLPDDELEVQSHGLGGHEVRVTWLGRDWQQDNVI